MRVDQQLHGFLDRGRLMPNSSLNLPSAASRSSGSIGSRKTSSGIFQCRQAPLRRGAMLLTGTSRANGLPARAITRSEEHTSELQSHVNLVCRLLLEKK